VSTKIYTIGHSTHTIEEFIGLLERVDIDIVIDVRTTPYSKFVPAYNQEALKASLLKKKIRYLYMGNLLGAKHRDRALLFENAQVDFEKVERSKVFQQGITRLQRGVQQKFTMALMCSEKEAFVCHRFGMIGAFLSFRGVSLWHIHPDKICSQQELEARLLQKYAKKLPSNNLFEQVSRQEQLKAAYRLHNRSIGFKAL
jgi:uncharacterized protein (DUF488 family)